MTAQPTPVSEQPLDEFTNCHDGILSRLQALDRLPALLGPAAEARRLAAEALDFFDSAVLEHHDEEERELFPAVLASALAGAERQQVQALADRLTAEHRAVEAAWQRLKPQLKHIASGASTTLDATALAALVSQYTDHARYEEQHFLPLSQQILARNDNHLAALGLSLHLRRALPGVLERFGHRI